MDNDFVELAVIFVLIMAGFAIPNILSITRSARNSGDARSISAAINMARMRAAADFTHARLHADLTKNTFHVETWNKASSCWQTDGDTDACTQASSPVISLDTGDTFGFGVVFSDATLAGIDAADPVMHEALNNYGVHWDSISDALVSAVA